MSFYSKIITVPSEFNIEKYMNTFFIGGFAVHLIVVLFDYFLMIKPFAFESRDIFSRSIISTLMHPAVIICGLFSVVIWFIWEKRKKALDLAHKTEIQKEKVDAVFKSMERITGLFAEHVAVQNSVIMSWIEYKKRKGQL